MRRRRISFTRNWILKLECVLAERAAMRVWLREMGAGPELASGIMAGHRDALRSLARELPLALALDIPGVAGVWARWKRGKSA